MLTLPIMILLGCGFFFLALPSLLNLYLFPRLLADLPFTEKELSLYSITPWKASGVLTLANPDQPGVSVPRFELTYTPGSLARGKIDGLLLDSAALHLDMQDGHPVIRGLSGYDTPAGKQSNRNDNSTSILLPLAVETVILKNCTLTLQHEQQEPSRIIVDGRFDLGFLESPRNSRLLATATGQIVTEGDLAMTGAIDLHALDTGYEATATFSRLQFKQDDFIFATNATEQPILLRITGNREKTRYTLANIVLSKPEKATLSMTGEIEAAKGTFRGIGQIFFPRTKSAVSVHLSGEKRQSQTIINYALAGEAMTTAEAFSVSPFTAEGNIIVEGGTLTVQLNGKVPEITLKKSRTTLTGLSFQLPLQWPPPRQTGTAGIVKIEQIGYQNKSSGTLQAKISQSPQGVSASTLLTTPFVPGLQLVCEGSAQMTGQLAAHCRIPATKIDSTTLPRFLSLPDKLSFTGILAADGVFGLTDAVPTGKITVEFHNGTLKQGKNKLSNIDLSVIFPHLPLLQSAPGQLCTIGSADFGKIRLSEGRIHFRVEDEQAVFLEKIRLSWCGGKVETGSFSLAKDMKELETTLYCDRLGFTELLAQFGIDKAEGQGSLNGRLPMVISRQGVKFDDGFLFSTPGNSGIVRFNDTRQLRQGIPDINKSSYLDYSMEALTNFSYNWTKLTFNSRDKDLLITMQLDGKPAEPLPFGYKNGQLVPSDKGPGLQHPIRLDVNFRLPMHDIFQYGTSIQSMLEKM